ncbi:circularly permutated Ras protein 1-like isoform X2 [Eleutherodactylus coqui]|uniref:circularly permutated Ras protein 1-like isoform X2 n=1 Tax=Eleutherodactylus coqui TaxID=57060 RepID=UPI003461EFB5
MEFGCRYIYVDESRGQNEVYLESHLSPVTVPESQNVVALNPAFYDNVPHAEEPRSDEVKGLQHYRLSPECNVQQDLQTTSVQLEGQKIPPPVPPRRRKPSAPAPPGPKKPHCRLSPEYNVYEDLPPTYLVQLDDNKTPPPLPFRKNMSIDSGKPAHHATNEGPTEQPTIIIGSTVQKCRPPVPDRKMKPSLHKPAGLLQDEQYYVALPPVDHTDLDPTIQHGMKNPPIHQMSGLLPGVAIGPNPHNYLEVLPTLPTEMKMQAAPVKPPDRQMTSLPDPPIERLPANCNILLLNIGKMVENSDTHVQEPPLLCISCSAACSKLNHIQDTKTWTCVFCAAENPLSDDNRFESREEGDELYAGDRQFENEYLFADQAMIIFCIDISGSMSVTTEVTQDQSNDYNIAYKTRMEAVKSALDETLEFLHKQHSEKRVALVTFSDQVKLYGDGTTQPLVLQGAELLDPDHLKLQGIDQPMPHPVTETLHALKGRIQCLEEKGATALGPAALVSIAMASKNPGSKVIICTDGKANTELGNLEDISEEYSYQSSKLYYSNLGDLALQHSVAVSVVTIEGTYCRLPELGQLADKTGGKVNIVHPFKLANEFQSIIGEEIIATNVKLKVFLPQTMYFLYEGNNESVLERTFGSTTADTVLSTEFSIHSSKINEVLRYSQLPIQVHLSYTLPDGRSRLRILSQTRPVTNDCTAALECIDLSVLQIHSVQFSARLAMEGRVNEARNVALELKELIDLVMTHENKAYGVVYEDWEDSMSPIYEDLQVYMKKPEQTVDSHIEEPVVKSFSDEMAKMIFHMKRAKNKVLNKLRSQTE